MNSDSVYNYGDDLSRINHVFSNFEQELHKLCAERNRCLEKVGGFDSENADLDSEAFDFALKEYEDASTSYSVFCRSFAEFVLANRDHIKIE